MNNVIDNESEIKTELEIESKEDQVISEAKEEVETETREDQVISEAKEEEVTKEEQVIPEDQVISEAKEEEVTKEEQVIPEAREEEVTKEEKVMCPICNKFFTKKGITRHINYTHKGGIEKRDDVISFQVEKKLSEKDLKKSVSGEGEEEIVDKEGTYHICRMVFGMILPNTPPEIPDSKIRAFSDELYIYCEMKGINIREYLFDEIGLVATLIPISSIVLQKIKNYRLKKEGVVINHENTDSN